MDKQSKHDVMCIERGDVDYLRNIADMLMKKDEQVQDQGENIALALRGIANAAYELDQLDKGRFRIDMPG